MQHRNLKRERLYKSFKEDGPLCYFPLKLRGIHSIGISKDLIAFNPVFQRVKIPRGDRILQKSYVFPPFQRGAN
jgi:hypothetical protein